MPPTPNPLQADANGNIDALASVKISHEHLLSIIAAFIGHIHSHSASSHPSSHAHLLDVTRDCIDNVRELLTDGADKTAELPNLVGEFETLLAERPRQ